MSSKRYSKNTLNKLWHNRGLTSEITEKLDNAVFPNDDIVFGDIDTDFVTFFWNDIALNSINLTIINLDHDNFDDCDSKTINHIRLMTSYNIIDLNKIRDVKNK